MTGRDLTASFAATLVDEWVRAGVRHAVVSPGSRNTPLLLALARDGRVHVDVVLDERSGAFRALGIALATNEPAIACCTSGTAAANFHPAVVEAFHARVPMLVCTADRPPELRDCGAPQTIDQARLFGSAVRWFHDPGPPDARSRPRAIAQRAYAYATGRPPGPVHLNLPFREPLVPTDTVGAVVGPVLDAVLEPALDMQTTRAHAPVTIAALADLVRQHAHGVIVAGHGARCDPAVVQRFAASVGWPVLADPLSQLRTGECAISTYEVLARVASFPRPEVVVRIGAPLTSKVTNAWLREVPHVLIDPDDVWLDPDRTARRRIVAEPDDVFAAISRDESTWSPWMDMWLAAERAARSVIDAYDAPIEGCIARDVVAAIPDGGSLLVASSLPVRALDWCMAPRGGLRIFSNRGANGIDGFVSTVAGVARASHAPTVALTGDLCFLHDVNGLAAMPEATTFVVIDNGGGGIFSFLPQRGLAEFESLFATPHGLDIAEVARAHGVAAERLGADADWRAVIGDRVRVAVVAVDRDASVEAHKRMWDAAVTAVEAVSRVPSLD